MEGTAKLLKKSASVPRQDLLISNQKASPQDQASIWLQQLSVSTSQNTHLCLSKIRIQDVSNLE